MQSSGVDLKIEWATAVLFSLFIRVIYVSFKKQMYKKTDY